MDRELIVSTDYLSEEIKNSIVIKEIDIDFTYVENYIKLIDIYETLSSKQNYIISNNKGCVEYEEILFIICILSCLILIFMFFI